MCRGVYIEMKKIKTLFERVIVNHEVVDILPNVTEGCEWVLMGEGVATRKWDGTACAIIDGKLYARYDYYTIKHGKRKMRTLPDGSIPCQDRPDEVTGHFPHWVPVLDKPEYKWYIKAFEKRPDLQDSTYELIGEHIKGNPERVESGDILVSHDYMILGDVPRTFDGIRDYLRDNYIEGIVFHREDGEMCKIKRTDFHFMWNGSYSSR